MRITHISGYKRLGIVCSGLWLLLAVTFYFLGIFTDPSFISHTLRKLYTWQPAPDWAQPYPPGNPRFVGLSFALFVFLPVVIGWLLLYVIPRSVRWVIDGFQKPAKIPPSLTVETIEPDAAVKNRTDTETASSISTIQNQEMAPAQVEKAPESEIPPAQTTPQPNKKDAETKWPIIPLVLIIFWIFYFVFPQAIAVGVSDKKYLLLNTLVYCLTPITIIVLLLLLYWFAKSYQSYRSSKISGGANKRSAANLSSVLSIGIGTIVLGSVAYFKSHSAWEQRVAKDAQDMQAKGINVDALKGWEVAKTNHNIGDAKTGLSPDFKKMMREQFALAWRGELLSIEGVSVELEGESHDRLVFSFKGALATNASAIVVEAMRQNDPDFGNRLRFLNFREMVLAGTNDSETFSQTDFSKWSQSYDAFVTNEIATYGTLGNQNSFFSKKSEISPVMQKTMRSNLANVLNGAFKSIYKSFEVKLAGTNDDVLDLSCKDASENDMNGLLNRFREDETGNFFNGLTAMGISELVLEGGAYRRSIPRSEFIQWCRNYDQYMAELQKLVGQMSDGMKRNDNTP